jgi:hypothetical protein
MRTAAGGSESIDDLFELGDQFLVSPDSAALKSALIPAVDRRRDEPVILKYWTKTQSPIDSDLREMWRHEMRQLDRVRAYPGADEVIVESEHGECSDAFFLKMPGDFGPLDHVRRRAGTGHWLNNLRGVRFRATLWRNMRRLAQALGAVHGQGLVHGRISEASIFTSSANTADFRLGGFEWCVRIVEADSAPVRRVAKSRGTPIVLSFIDDWRALGKLAAGLLGLDRQSLDAEAIAFQPGHLLIDLHPSEIDFLRALIQPDRRREFDSRIVVQEIDSVLTDLGVESFEDTGKYVLALRLGETSKLTAALRTASEDSFDPGDFEAQLDFVRADLATGAKLVAMSNGGLALLTDTLSYVLRPFSQAGTENTWRVATCDYAWSRNDFTLGRRNSVDLPAHRIEVIRFGMAARRLQELHTEALEWNGVFVTPAENDPTRVVRRGMLLALVAEALFRVAANIPVRITGRRGRGPDGGPVVVLAPRDDEDREALADALKVDMPVRMMTRQFREQEADTDAVWELSESGGLGTPARHTVNAAFVRPVTAEGQRSYEFRLDGPVPPAPALFLRQREEGGTEGAIRRRLRMLAALATQHELSLTLSDPRQRLRTYSETLLEDAAFGKLDPSKQEALRSIWSTGPMQFVVGPPGVGKTKLVTEIVRRVLSGDTAARLLLSAQAHQALDNLALSVQTALAEAGLENEVLLIRSRSDSAAALPGVQPQDRATAYLRAVKDSPLGRAAPVAIRQSIAAMEAATAERKIARAEADPGRQRHSFEALLLQCANVLFSTANSGDLEQLVDDRAQFDWVMIEEAAKATGPELLAPLLLSMRRLLIGDHNQLPPFDTKRLRQFLGDITRVRTAYSQCDALIGATFRDFGLDDLSEAIGDDSTLAQTCQMASRLLLLFESLVEHELQGSSSSGSRLRVAWELREQHRMHPVIASVIAECFYPGPDRLVTADDSKKKFAEESPPFEILDPRLSASPIVIVDMLYVQRGPGAGDELPIYHNPAEIEAVRKILSGVRPGASRDGKAPTLAVLSPYREQVRRLHLSVEDWMNGPLAGIKGFASPVRSGELVGTVDSFQGSEADLVVVSLVRNNDHVGRRALGFLSERPRMNVLLSRAKWKLVIVTSLDFLRVQARRYQGRKGSSETEFLATLIGAIDRMKSESLPDGTPKVTVVSVAKLGEALR